MKERSEYVLGDEFVEEQEETVPTAKNRPFPENERLKGQRVRMERIASDWVEINATTACIVVYIPSEEDASYSWHPHVAAHFGGYVSGTGLTIRPDWLEKGAFKARKLSCFDEELYQQQPYRFYAFTGHGTQVRRILVMDREDVEFCLRQWEAWRGGACQDMPGIPDDNAVFARHLSAVRVIRGRQAGKRLTDQEISIYASSLEMGNPWSRARLHKNFIAWKNAREDSWTTESETEAEAEKA